MSSPFIGLLGKQKSWMTLLTNLYTITTLKVYYFWKNFHESSEMQTWYNAFQCFLVNFMKSGYQFEKGRNCHLHFWNCHLHSYKRNSHLHNYIIETVMCIMHCRKYNPTETLTCIITIKIVTHIFAAETLTCISAAETSNYIIATETVTWIIATERSTNITVTESTTCIIAIEPQKLHNCNSYCHLHNCYRKCLLHSSNRNCHLQKWLQKLSLAEMVPLRDSFSYNKEIEGMSKHQV